MAKIKLGSRPKNFKREIKFPMLDGTTGTFNATFKYMTRSEYAEFIDARIQEAVAAEKTSTAAPASADSEILYSAKADSEKTDAAKVSFVMAVVESWDLDVPFDREAVTQLADEIPAGITAVIDTYRMAVVEGRLGN